MAKKQTTINLCAGAQLTPKEAAALTDSWVMPFLCYDETIGDFLLLITSICYERDMGKREAILIEIENTLMPYAPSVGDALRALMTKRLAVRSLIKEGGTQ
jgi:hypothetical protein